MVWEFVGNAGGFKNVGFRSANFAKVIARKFGRSMGAGTVLELSALPNLQVLPIRSLDLFAPLIAQTIVGLTQPTRTL